MVTVSSTTIVAAIKDQLSCDLAGEAVILLLGSGTLFGLGEIGAVVWNALQQPKSVGEIVTYICERYDVDRDRCELDVLRNVNDMVKAGLVRICEDTKIE